MKQKTIIEGLIFLAGEEGLTFEQICSALDHPVNDAVVEDLETLKKQYADPDSGIELTEFSNRYKFITKEAIYPYGQRIFEHAKPASLSQAALETLAIVAYKQPITRVEIEEIRGVNCEVMLKKLQAQGLIEAKDRLDTVGKPLLYTVTDEFLDAFELNTLAELPELPQHDGDEDLFGNEEEE
ncbi:MAG: SMC-Scp complex subunit ScpB [Catenisphaera adipataccumulans]|jgi:segregation and condensation protein B|uniref:SMC-Scp complex subunit ScpB n=1 Tax=Catenisphaera adipataccumulans TaxID=700500 RepID=UPI003D8A8537